MKRTIALALGALASAGCYDAYSNENILFLKALPRGLEVDVPGADAGTSGRALRPAQLGDEKTQFYVDAFNAGQDINRIIEEIFEHIDGIVENVEPVAEEDNVRLWGPIPIEDGLEIGLIIERVETATVARFFGEEGPVAEADLWWNYILAVRPQGGTDASWVPAVAGTSIVYADEPIGTGRLILNQAVLAPHEGNAVFIIPYDARGGQNRVAFGALSPQAPMRYDFVGYWDYHRQENGDRSFLFYLPQNIPGTGPGLEEFIVYTRWRADFYGRADVVIKGGDLPSPFFATECWDPGWIRTFFFTTVPELAFQNMGLPSDCAEGLRNEERPGG